MIEDDDDDYDDEVDMNQRLSPLHQQLRQQQALQE